MCVWCDNVAFAFRTTTPAVFIRLAVYVDTPGNALHSPQQESPQHSTVLRSTEPRDRDVAEIPRRSRSHNRHGNGQCGTKLLAE